MPVELQRGFNGDGPFTRVRVSDDVEQARKDGVLDTCALAILIAGFTDGDELEVKLNDQVVPWRGARVEFGGWTKMQVARVFWGAYPTYPERIEQDGTRISFDVACPPLKQGDNIVEIHLQAQDGAPNAPVIVEDIEITVAYKTGA